MASLINHGNYNHVDASVRTITPTRNTWTSAKIDLASFDGRLSTTEVLALLSDPKHSPAPLEALLFLGAQFPVSTQSNRILLPGHHQGGLLDFTQPQPIQKFTADYGRPTVVCLCEPHNTCVENHPQVVGISFGSSFGPGPSLIGYMLKRDWVGEDFCFPVITEVSN
jgi:hypothetical protein